MNKLNVLVVMGGTSFEREISLKTGAEILKYIDKEKYNVSQLIINHKKDIFKILNEDIDFVFIALHGEFGEDGKVQAILETMDIKYTGNDMITSAICMNKDIFKKICIANKLPIIQGVSFTKNDIIEFDKLNHLGTKKVLKPFDGGSSIGIYIVDNKNDYNNAVKEIFKISSKIIVEKYIKGIEISVPVIDNKVYPTVRITPLKSTFFDYKSKYDDNGAIEEVFEFEKDLQNKINELSLKIYNLFNCKTYVRIDYLVENDEIYILEINTLPGMTSKSLLPKSLNSMSISYTNIIDMFIESSLKKENN